jgi:DNA-binding SARP family transcriptional activator/TolB-like protein
MPNTDNKLAVLYQARNRVWIRQGHAGRAGTIGWRQEELPRPGRTLSAWQRFSRTERSVGLWPERAATRLVEAGRCVSPAVKRSSSSMFTLRLFGGVALAKGTDLVAGRAAQKRRLALLTRLAASPHATLSRDKLIACLWPESSTEQARHLLSTSLYDLRQALGEDVIVTCGDDLRLNPARLHTEVEDFEAALETGDWVRAVAVYAGPFGDGFHVTDAGEFEYWLEVQRERYAGRYREALERLAEEQAAGGDLLGAADTWRRLAAEDPFNTRVTLRLMRALEAVGDRAAALRRAGMHATLLREELGAAPDPEMEALSAQLREAPAPESARVGDVARSERPSSGVVTPSLQPPVETAVRPTSTGYRPRRPLLRVFGLRRRGDRRRGLMLLGLLALLVVGVAISVWKAPPVEAHSARIAVLPFTYHGSSEYEYLAAGMVDLLSANLDGTGGLRSVDPRALLALSQQPRAGLPDPERGRAIAARFAAGHVVLGSISEAGGRLRISASLYESAGRSEPVTTVIVEGESGQLFELIDRLTGRLLAEGLMRDGTRLDGLAALTTASMPALQSYLEGMSLLRQGRFDMAVDVFEQAVAADSAFALAHYRLCIAAAWAKRFDVTRLAAARAVRHGDHLLRRDRLLLEGVLAIHEGRPDEAEGLFRDLLGAYPDDVEGWLQLGEVLYHYSAPRGRHPSESVPAWEQALVLEPGNRFAHAHIAFVAAEQQDVATLLRAHDAISGTGDADPLALAVALLAALGSGRRADEARITEQLQRATGGAVTEAVWTAMAVSRNFAGVERVAALLDEGARPPERFTADRLRLAHMHMARGRWTRAGQQLLLAQPRDSAAALLHLALATGLEFGPFRPAEALALRVRLEQWEPARDTAPGYYAKDDQSVFRLYLLGLLHIRLGELQAAERHARELWQLPGVDPVLAQDLSLSLRAQVARQRGELQVALSLLEQVRGTGTPYNRALGSPFRARSYERYLRADVLRELGHSQEALRWYGTLGTLSPLEVVYLAPAHLAQARIHADLGNRALARWHHARFLDLWASGDVELQALVHQSRAELEQL